MAKDNVEIEIKIPVNEPTYRKVKEWLEGTADFVSRFSESDTYYSPAHRDFLKPDFPYEWLRLRHRGNTVAINYKHLHPENAPDYVWRDEFNAEILNSESLEKILQALDFVQLVNVNKKREVFKCFGEFEIDLDFVEGLGLYVEIEALRSFGTHEETLAKVKEFAYVIGLDPEKSENRGYAYLLLEKAGKLNK